MGRNAPINEGAFFMSKETIKWHYLPPQTDLAESIEKTKLDNKKQTSIFTHWGIHSRQQFLEAHLQDQQDNLHSLIGQNTCTCGLVLQDSGMTTVLDFVLSKHHRNPLTFEPDENPNFRGLVGKRLFGLGNQVQTDMIWDNFVIQNVSTMINGILVVPLSWTLVREGLDKPWLPSRH